MRGVRAGRGLRQEARQRERQQAGRTRQEYAWGKTPIEEKVE